MIHYSSVSFIDCEGGVSAGPPTPPASYDKVMTAILQELKFLHMQSAAQGELNEMPCKDLLDGTAVMASLLCRHIHSLHNPKDPFHSEESKFSEHLSLCKVTLDQNVEQIEQKVNSDKANRVVRYTQRMTRHFLLSKSLLRGLNKFLDLVPLC